MTLSDFLAVSGIPIMLSLIGFYYAWRLLKMKDLDCIRGKKRPPVRKKYRDAYATSAGKMILWFSSAVVLNAVLVWINQYVALIEILLSFGIFIYMWRKLVDKYE